MAHSGRLLNIAVVLTATFIVLLLMGPEWWRLDLHEDDAAQHIFWLYRFIDGQLFPDDISAEYFASIGNAPPGYTALYGLIARIWDPLAAAEWLAIGVLAITMVLFAALARTIWPAQSRLATLCTLTVFAVVISSIELIPTAALQRAFAMPLMLAMLLALIKERYAWVGWTWLFAALVYPVIVPVMGLTAGLCFLRDLLVRRTMPQSWLINGALGAASLALIFYSSATDPGIYGPSATHEDAQAMAEFAHGGRQALYGNGWEDIWLTNHRTGLGITFSHMLATAVSVLILGVSGAWRRVPFAVVAMALTGVAVWMCARYMLFDLYLPNRHSRWTVNSASILIITAAAMTLLKCLSDFRWQRAGEADRAIAGGFAISCIVVTVAALAPSAWQRWSQPIDYDLERAYDYLASMPKDTVIAGHPGAVNFVPLRAHRSVLVSTEVSTANMLGYYGIMKPRLTASLNAMYASTWKDFDAALAPWGVDAFLVHPSFLDNPRYIKPFDTLVQARIAEADPGGFVVAAPPPDRVLFRSGEVLVISVRSVPERSTAG